MLLAYTKRPTRCRAALGPPRRPLRCNESSCATSRRPARAVRRGDARPPPATGDRRHRPGQQMVNRAGTSFDFRMTDETGADVADIARAHVVASDVHGDAASVGPHRPPRSLHRHRRAVRAVPGPAAHGRAGRAVAAAPPASTARSRGDGAAFGPGIEELAGGLRAVVHGAMGATLAEAAETR